MGRRKKEKVKCNIEYCENVAVTKGMCGRHYNSLRNYGDPMQVDKNKEEKYKVINGIEHKKCKSCEEIKPTSEFYKIERVYSNKNGDITEAQYYQPSCKICSIEQSNKWIEENKERFIERQKELAKQEKYIIKNRETSKRQRERGGQREWGRRNKDKIHARYKRRYSKKKHDISELEWINCKQYFEHKCAYCGMSEDIHKKKYGEQLHKEHVIDKGANDLSNCVPACKVCNGSKWTYELEEWYNENNENFDQDRLDKIHKWINEDYLNYIK